MPIKSKIMLFLVLPLMYIISVQPMRAEGETAKLIISSTNIVDVCSQEKRVIVEVSFGEVFKNDSLMYFDIELKFDQKKLEFYQILTLGTLSEQFTGITAQGDFSKKGFASAVAANIQDIPVSGNKPLVVFFGRALSNCEDSVEISLSDLDTDFKRTFSDTLNAIVRIKEVPSPARIFSLKATSDTIRFNDTVEQNEVEFVLQGSSGTKVQEGILKVDYDKSSFKVSQIEPSTSNIEVLKTSSTNKGVEISFKNNDTISTAQRKIKVIFERQTEENLKSRISAVISEINQCSCVAFLKDTVKIEAENTHTVLSSIQSEIYKGNLVIQNNDDYWLLKESGECEVKIYSLLGQVAGIYTGINEVKIDKATLTSGNYIVFISNKTDNSNKIIILNK